LSLAVALALPWSLTVTLAAAQAAPDAGRILQQLSPPLQAPVPAPDIGVQTPVTPRPAPGGPQVLLKSISFQGNSLMSSMQLQALLGDAPGKNLDLAGLRGLADRVTEHYRAAGYLFSRAYLPPQAMQDGNLQIQVIEGSYGMVQARSDEAALAIAGQAFLQPLQPGAVIASGPLERAILILDDQPGIRSSPLIRPGSVAGTGDLDVSIDRGPRLGGDLGVDNHGNRYTGRYRAYLNLHADSPWTLGDQISVRALATSEAMWLGALGYSLPLGASGLRGSIGHTHVYYKLGGSFATSQATGTADVTSLGVSYPLLRTQRANLYASAGVQAKQFTDKNGLAGTRRDKSSTTLPFGLQFDRRDGLGGGGVTYGALGWTPGQLRLDPVLLAADSSSARSAGSFRKINLDLARLQAITSGVSLLGRVSAQHASKNLDSSEDFGLGGANGVRAYPNGEAYGDSGWLAQIELRYAVGAYVPYAFYDTGQVRTNAALWSPGTNDRKLAGAGFGVRHQGSKWNVEAAIAWRTRGGAPQSDAQDQRTHGTQVWLNLTYLL
jgi:hemolysin activation/secretion protein